MQIEIDKIDSKFGFNNWLEFLIVDVVIVVAFVEVVVVFDVLVVVSNVVIEDDIVVVVESDFVLGMTLTIIIFVVICSECVLSIVVDLTRFSSTSYIHVLKNPILV